MHRRVAQDYSPPPIGFRAFATPAWPTLIVVLASLEVADKLGVAFLLSVPMFAFLGCIGGGFHGFLSPAYGASA